mmetsp:Transcript_8280/g.17536  ORF Transcript_8280/g.17536 Transcript_8280/m.17536 type:complete len:226 (-) Transcript_8280:293-970(-)
MHKNIRKVSAFQGKRASMQNSVTLIQYHVPWLHGDIVKLAIMSHHLEWPWFINILCDINDNGGHKGDAVDMCGEDVAFFVDSYPIKARRSQLLPGPLLHSTLRCLPNCFPDRPPRSLKLIIFNVDHVGRLIPIINKGIAPAPMFFIPSGFITIGVPEFSQEIKDEWGGADLLETKGRVIRHSPRLHQVHVDPVPLHLVALPPHRRVPVPTASLHQTLVVSRPVSQ